jgi:four helix bundle protein
MRKWEVGIGDMACEIRKPEFGIVEQESDESLYWLELLKESGIAKGKLLEELLVEADELVAIFTTIGKKSK